MLVAGLCRLLARRAFGSRRSRRRTCPTTPPSRVDGGEIGRAQAMQAGPRARARGVRLTRSCSSPAATARSQLVVLRPAGRRPSGPATTPSLEQKRRAEGGARRPATSCAVASTWCSAKARARRPRSTSPATSPTWGWPGRRDLPVLVVGDLNPAAPRRPLRDAPPARARGSAARLRVPDQQVPRLPALCFSRASNQLPSLAGPPDPRRAPVSRGRTDEDSLALSHLRGDPPLSRGRVSSVVGDPVAAPLQLDRHRGARARARVGRRASDPADLADADARRVPGKQGHRGGPARGCGSAGWPRLSSPTPGSARPVLGICGGFQMLCRHIDDVVESEVGGIDCTLGPRRGHRRGPPTRRCVVSRPPARIPEIRHGQVSRSAEEDWLGLGIRSGRLTGPTGTDCSTTIALRRDIVPLPPPSPRTGPSRFLLAYDVDVGARLARLAPDGRPYAPWTSTP